MKQKKNKQFTILKMVPKKFQKLRKILNYKRIEKIEKNQLKFFGSDLKNKKNCLPCEMPSRYYCIL